MSIPSLIRLGAAGAAGVLGVTGLARSSKGESFLDVLQTALLPDASAAQTSSPASDADIVSSEAADPGTDQSDLEEDVADLSRRILQRLNAAGIDLTIPIELRTDGIGGVAVDDPHPQRAEIEQLIATDSELTSSFYSVAAAYTADEVMRTETGGNRWSEFRLKLNRSGGQVAFE